MPQKIKRNTPTGETKSISEDMINITVSITKTAQEYEYEPFVASATWTACVPISKRVLLTEQYQDELTGIIDECIDLRLNPPPPISDAHTQYEDDDVPF